MKQFVIFFSWNERVKLSFNCTHITYNSTLYETFVSFRISLSERAVHVLESIIHSDMQSDLFRHLIDQKEPTT